MEDTWHNWNSPEKASGTEEVAVAQWQGQKHPFCPVASAAAEELHPAELKLQVGPEEVNHSWSIDRRRNNVTHYPRWSTLSNSLLGHIEVLQEKQQYITIY